MSFQHPALQSPQDIESLKAEGYEQAALVSPSLAEALKAKYVEHPQSLDNPADVLAVLEKCKTTEGALIVCSGLYVDAAVSVMDTMSYWNEAGRPSRELAGSNDVLQKFGLGPVEYCKSAHQLGLLNRAMSEIKAGITVNSSLNFEALIWLNDAVLWKQLVAMCQKLPETARFLRERLP